MSCKPLLIAAAAAAALAASPSQALVMSFHTAPGATSGSYAVSGEATITTRAGEVDVTLTNFFVQNLVSVAQNLSGIGFGVTGLAGSGGAVSYLSGQHVRLTDPAGATPPALDPDPGTPVWNLARPTPASLYLSVFGAGQPKNTLLPELTDPSQYAGINGSVAGGVHNPYYLGSVGFAITGLQGVTDDSEITDLVFRYNTDATRVPSVPEIPNIPDLPTVPEPGSLALLAMGMAAIGLVARRRRAA